LLTESRKKMSSGKIRATELASKCVFSKVGREENFSTWRATDDGDGNGNGNCGGVHIGIVDGNVDVDVNRRQQQGGWRTAGGDAESLEETEMLDGGGRCRANCCCWRSTSEISSTTHTHDLRTLRYAVEARTVVAAVLKFRFLPDICAEDQS
jgi:hypothetical protein